MTIDAQVEAPSHNKFWLDGKAGSDRRFCQQCMCPIVTPEEDDTGKQKMLNAKWIDPSAFVY